MDKLKARKMHRLKNPEGRGCKDDVVAQVAAFKAIYNDFYADFKEREDDEKQAFIDHFNGLEIEDNDTVGTTLASGDASNIALEIEPLPIED